jgi:DNA repair protein RadA/Sms
MGVDLACTGSKVLYLALEQTPCALKEIIESRVFPHRHAAVYEGNKQKLDFKTGLQKVKERVDVGTQEQRVERNFFIDSSVGGMEALPDFLTRQVIGSSRQYSGTEFIFVDSIQGLGTAPTSSRPYQKLFEFNRWAKEHGISVILVGHITKGGAIAGPRSLEHNVDSVLYMRKAMRFRPLFVPKNRFGPERHEPLTLVMNNAGCLEKSKHVKAKASWAVGYLPSSPDLIEVQALVKLPKYGERPGIQGPYLPRQKLRQLVGIVSSLRDIDISDLTFEINCAIPGGRPYFHTLDLPLVVSMLSSYFQTNIPTGSLFVGEIDLTQAVRPLTAQICESVAQLVVPNGTSPCVERIFVSDKSTESLAEKLAAKGSVVKVHGIADLESLVQSVWPDAIQKQD